MIYWFIIHLHLWRSRLTLHWEADVSLFFLCCLLRDSVCQMISDSSSLVSDSNLVHVLHIMYNQVYKTLQLEHGNYVTHEELLIKISVFRNNWLINAQQKAYITCHFWNSLFNSQFPPRKRSIKSWLFLIRTHIKTQKSVIVFKETVCLIWSSVSLTSGKVRGWGRKMANVT